MLAPGSRIARYEIEERLGEGAYGAVYRARDPVLGRTVAIKVIRAEAIAANEANHTRFVREGRAVAALSHPNIVSVFDAGEAEGVAFIVMEYVKGRPLRTFVGDLRVSTRTRMKWLTDVARALAFSHRAGLVHRDIKPENVLIADEGTVKVVDFGIARHTEDELESTQLTREGQMVGTPLYMAPEQMFGEPADARCDQFSWGVMAFELFSGGLPWSPQGGVLTFVESVHRQPPRELVALGGDVPRGVATVVERAIARDAAQRHPSMDAVVAALTARLSASSLPASSGVQPAPISSPSHAVLPYSAPPYSAPPYSAPPYSAPPYSAPPYSAPPYSAPSYPEPPYSTPSYPEPPSGPGSAPSRAGSARAPLPA